MDLFVYVNLLRSGWALRTSAFAVQADVSEKEAEMIGKAPKSRRGARRGDGFSLIELMISVAILLVITGATLSIMSSYQKTYGTTQLKADMFMSLRGVSELMAQEIGQAGVASLYLPPQAGPTLSAGVVGGIATNVPVSSASGMFVGENLLIDTGAPQETVTLTAVTLGPPDSITAMFQNSHNVGAPINIQGVFRNGLMTSSTATQLRMFGDINADGTLVYVHYDCNTVAGTLTRSVTIVTPTMTTSNAGQTLLNNLWPNPGGTPCFQYTTVTTVNGPYTFVTNVGVTLSVRSQQKDLVTHDYLTMTKSFMNLVPRNALTGVELANSNLIQFLQPTPAPLKVAPPLP